MTNRDSLPEDHALATTAPSEIDRPLNSRELLTRLATIQDVMRHVMKPDQDYGVIPGTPKPTLYKPGAEKLCLTFRLVALVPTVEAVPDYTGSGEIHYRVQVPIAAADGRILAVGVGECSTGEEKYRWRRPVHQNEYDAALPDQRREKYQRDGRVWQQVRTNPADVANTVLKMAHKRAYVHGVVMATAAGAIFTQDIEDLPDGYLDEEAQPAAPLLPPQRRSSNTPGPRPVPPPPSTAQQHAGQPAAPSGSARKISEAQARRFFAIAMGAGWTKDALRDFLKSEYGLEHSRDIPADRYEELVAVVQSSQAPAEREPGADDA